MEEPTWYDRLLSSLGYEALDVLFGVKSELLNGDQKKRLVYLGQLAADNPEVAKRVDNVLTASKNELASRKAALLLEILQEPPWDK